MYREGSRLPTKTNKSANSLTESSKLHSSSTHVKADPAVPTRRSVVFAWMTSCRGSWFLVTGRHVVRLGAHTRYRVCMLHWTCRARNVAEANGARTLDRITPTPLIFMNAIRKATAQSSCTPVDFSRSPPSNTRARYSKLSARALIKFIGFAKRRARTGVGYIRLAVNPNVCDRRASTQCARL